MSTNNPEVKAAAKAALNAAAQIRHEAGCLSTNEPGIIDLVYRSAECIERLAVALARLAEVQS